MDITDVAYRFQLDQCLDWIIDNKFCRVIIQLLKEDLSHAVQIVNYLRDKHNDRLQSDNKTNDHHVGQLDLYVTKSDTCCIDLIVTQHITGVDAIIHIGKVCLSKPEINNDLHMQIPILIVFGRPLSDIELFERNIKAIKSHIDSTREAISNCRICLFYDTSLIDYANKLEEMLHSDELGDIVDVAKLYCPMPNWETTPSNRSWFKRNLNVTDEVRTFDQYILSKPLDYFNCAIYLGDRLSIQQSLNCPSKLFKIDCYNNLNLEPINVSRLLNKRMALVSRMKDQDELKIGVIITNPLPDLNRLMGQLESYAKARKHTLYFISMIQTIDECKIGNFDLCDAFVISNSCTCSTILESLVFNRPIITELEFKLACGFEAEYGRVMWPGSSAHLSEDDMINRRKVSDVSLALNHMRNELLERCSQARINKWSGLEYKATGGGSVEGGDADNGVGESLVVEKGLSGIASSYASEPSRESTTQLCNSNGQDNRGDIG